MRMRTQLLALAVLAVIVVTGAAEASETFKEVLPNGLTVIIRENHSSPVANLRFYVKSGSLYEHKWLGCGISHYCEHLQSDGTTNRTLDQIETEIETADPAKQATECNGFIIIHIKTPSVWAATSNFRRADKIP